MKQKKYLNGAGSGSPLRQLRTELGLTQAEFAKDLGISAAVEQKLEARPGPLSASLRERVRHVYGAVVTEDGVFDLVGSPYAGELLPRIREIGSSRILRDELLASLGEDLERLVQAAVQRKRLHALLPRLKRFFGDAAGELGLDLEIQSAARTAATISVGEIRARQRARPLRRRRERLAARLERLEVAAANGAAAGTGQISQLREKIATLDAAIAATQRKINVRGRRRPVTWEVDGQVLIIAPDVPNEVSYPISAPPPEFGRWWGSYWRELRSVCETPADAPGE